MIAWLGDGGAGEGRREAGADADDRRRAGDLLLSNVL
jgi:hypothetical protein